MGTPSPNATETSRGTISGTRAMVHCDLPPLLLPLLLIIGSADTQGVPGCYSLLCQLLVEQSQIPEVLAFSNDPPLPRPHKRVPGMEFVGKRAPGMEFLGKRAPGMEFLGKRASGMEFIGKRAPGMEFLGKRSMDRQSFHRSNPVLPEVLGLEVE